MRIEGSSLPEQIQTKKADHVAAGLQGQIERAQEELADLSQRKGLRPEEKQKKRRELEEKINGLRQQLQQHEIEKKKAEQEEKARKIQEEMAKKEAERKDQQGEEEQGISNAGMHAMISAGQSMEEADMLHHVRTRIEGQVHVTKGEIAASSSRGEDVSRMESQLAELEGKVAQVTGKIMKKYAEAFGEIKNAVDVEKTQEDKKADDEIEEKKEDEDNEDKEKAEQERRKINLQV